MGGGKDDCKGGSVCSKGYKDCGKWDAKGKSPSPYGPPKGGNDLYGPPGFSKGANSYPKGRDGPYGLGKGYWDYHGADDAFYDGVDDWKGKNWAGGKKGPKGAAVWEGKIVSSKGGSKHDVKGVGA